MSSDLSRGRAVSGREQELRDRSLELTQRHWPEIVAVGDELLRVQLLDGDEVEIIADRAAGDPDADLDVYRVNRGQELADWRQRTIDYLSSAGGQNKRT